MPSKTDPADLKDPALPARIQAGEPEALAMVVQAYLPRVMRAARASGLTVEQSEDVTQATFLVFLGSASRFEGRSQVGTWLFGILYRKISEARRKIRRDASIGSLDDISEDRFDASGRWLRPPRAVDLGATDAEIRQALETCLEKVPEAQRLAFVLREVEDLDTGEICKILDVTRTNLGVMLHRVRHRLRDCLESRGIKDGS